MFRLRVTLVVFLLEQLGHMVVVSVSLNCSIVIDVLSFAS